MVFLRSCVGAGVCRHGYPFFTGGVPFRTETGRAVEALGRTVRLRVRAFIASVALFFGGMLLVLGRRAPIGSFPIGAALAIAALNLKSLT